MNKSLITSVSPRECELIASGRQTMLVRKTRPKIETPFKSYIYCTALKDKKRYTDEFDVGAGKWIGNSRVIGEFVCKDIYVRPANIIYYGKGQKDYLDLLKSACMTEIEAVNYMNGRLDRNMYFLHISDLKIYDKPKELGEFRKPCNHINDCCTCKEAEFQYDGDELLGLICKREIPLTRQPHSWVYCEPIEEE